MKKWLIFLGFFSISTHPMVQRKDGARVAVDSGLKMMLADRLAPEPAGDLLFGAGVENLVYGVLTQNTKENDCADCCFDSLVCVGSSVLALKYIYEEGAEEIRNFFIGSALSSGIRVFSRAAEKLKED